MKAIEAELARMVEAGVSESQHRRATQAAVLQETRAELEKRLAALKLEAANKERRQRELLLAIDEDDRRNYRSYWQARLAYTADHAASADNAKAAPSPSPVVDPVVNTVLDQAGVPQYGALFAQHRVDAVVLRILTADDLQNMGITVVGDQKRILAAVAQLFDVKQ